ncbi:mitochondrial Nudix hydrolase (Nudix_Hydrolase_35) [Andalucia godoyi]|uniref:Mitochondrial Nudix hydrolase (Nudix_Hydrolase_35) n=1 Tax=Andalucia godoyi TaxID=505711 RepID=A0A8K0AGG4_ANDGO|nr:mitochondrial Nudix hydrolase (Nudix_Hydrolase_35) [Andalucia godoyi]|eukprot:ANDGO_00013.mRNA.1 mitochondrial Nudix hydrolase (Nudix_Hydrolase_35)
MRSFLLHSCRGYSLRIVFDASKFAAQCSEGCEAFIEARWQEKLKSNPRIFNGSKFRLHMFHIDDDERVCTLFLGLSDYRSYLGTNAAATVGFPYDDRHLSNILGVECIVRTSDDRLVVLKRSSEVADYPGACVFPGGHPEPSRVASHLNAESIAAEIRSAALQELLEETGIPPSSISEYQLCVVQLDSLRMNKPDIVFFGRTSLSSEEVLEVYSTAKDGFESTSILFLSNEDVASEKFVPSQFLSVIPP